MLCREILKRVKDGVAIWLSPCSIELPYVQVCDARNDEKIPGAGPKKIILGAGIKISAAYI